MSESQVELIRRIAKEVVYEILEEEQLLEPGEFFEFLNAIDAGIAAARQRVKERKGLYDMNKIKWTEAEGSKGPYERSEDVNSLDFKALLKSLQQHGGKMTVGDYFVWAFQNGHVIGRKRRRK